MLRYNVIDKPNRPPIANLTHFWILLVNHCGWFVFVVLTACGEKPWSSSFILHHVAILKGICGNQLWINRLKPILLHQVYNQVVHQNRINANFGSCPNMMVFHHVQAYEPWSKIGSYNHNQSYIPGWWFGTVFFYILGIIIPTTNQTHIGVMVMNR